MQTFMIICLKVSLVACVLYVGVNLLFRRHEHFEDSQSFLDAMEGDKLNSQL